MLARLTIPQQFYNWVCSKDPDATYNYTNCIECACGQFAIEALGLTENTPEFKAAWDNHFWGNRLMITQTSLNWIARGGCSGTGISHEWTYGRLRKRLEKMLPECVA